MGIENLDNLLMGDFDVSLDEAGRIAIPRDLRNALGEGKVVLTRGVNPCIRLYSAEAFLKRAKEVDAIADPDTAGGRDMLSRTIGKAHPIDIDKQGRILIPPKLREFAGLSKECVVEGQVRHIEIWDRERHEAHECGQEKFYERSEEFARKKELMNVAHNAHSGAAGRDDRISGAEGKE